MLDSTTLDITVAIDSSKLVAPWDIEWGFDNRLWMTDAKAIKRWDPTTGTLKVMYRFARGYGLGMALPKTAPSSGPLYVYAAFDTGYYYAGSSQFKLYRFEYNAAADTLINPVMLLALPHMTEHSGGKVVIGGDGKIWLTTAEYTFTNDTLNALNGRVLRMNVDGTAAAGNMRPDRTYSIGHRNAQGMVAMPDGKIIATEHSGPSLYDEINLITPGGHYGWPAMEGYDHCEGPLWADSCSSSTFIASHKQPIYAGMLTPAGIDYYDHPAIPEWRNCLIVGTLYSPDSCLAVLKMNTAHDTVLGRRNYLKKNAGGIGDFKRTRGVCAAADGSIYFIVLDREFTNIGDSLVNLRTRIVKVKNNAYVPPPTILTQPTEGGLSIYPLPADGSLRMVITDMQLLKQPYRVLDAQGRLITAGKTTDGVMHIVTGTWPAGNYELIIDGVHLTIARKLVISH